MNRFLRVLTVTAVVLLALGAAAVPALAASPSVTNLVTTTRFVRPAVDVPVFGVDLTAGAGGIGGQCTNLVQVLVDFVQVPGGTALTPDDLEANGAGTDPGGIEIWHDSSNPLQDTFDAGDAIVPSTYETTATASGFQATVSISPQYPLPPAEEGSFTFFVTVRMSDSVTNGIDFKVSLPQNAFDTEGALLCSDPSTPLVTTSTIIVDKTAPTIAVFTPPATQTSNFSWRISEPVGGVGQDDVALRLHGTTVDIPVSVSYEGATNTIIADPGPSLTAGQEYDAILQPNGPGGITDRAGNPLLPAPKTNQFRAATTVNELAPGVAYRWRNLANSSTYGGSYVVNNTPGASIAYTFAGSSIAWYTITDPNQGKASVSIDGRSFGTINNYSSTTKYKVGRSFKGLSSGTHTITIKVTGSKGSTAARDVRVSIDAFRSGGVTNVTPSLSYRWAAVSASGADGGSYRVARFSGTEMSFAFSGTSIAWRTVRGPSMGRAYVYIDGTLKGLFDNYSSTTSYKFMRAFLNLPAGPHTIKIKVASTRNSKATDRNIAIDGFVIG